MSVPDVSIVVVAHDVRDEVLRCLASVEAHAAPVTYELFLVDNGSTDGTAEAVESAFPATEVVHLPCNIGVAARNEGLRRARGRSSTFRFAVDGRRLGPRPRREARLGL